MNLLSLTMVVPVFLYSIIMEAGKKHATLGKYKMKTEVATVHSKTIQLWQIVVRNILKFLPWQFAHMMIFRVFALDWEFPPLWMSMFIFANMLPFVWIAVVIFRKDHRGIHDLFSKTVVINANSA